MEPSVQHAQTKGAVGIARTFAVFRSRQLAALRAFTVLLAAALLLALLAAACDGEGDSSEKVLRDLKALADTATEGATAKVTYQVTTSIDAETTQPEQTVVQRPPETRLDISLSAHGGGSRSTVINDGDKLYVCLAEEGTKGACLDVESASADAQEALAQAGIHVPVESPTEIELFDMPRLAAEGTDETLPLDSSRREVAGIDGTCFTQTSADLDTELCFSDEGLTLYWRFSQVSSEGVVHVFEATATSVSAEVTDEDFVPPYEISEGTSFETSES
jgi:hypothetical protein